MSNKISDHINAILSFSIIFFGVICYKFYREFEIYKQVAIEKMDENRKGIDLISSGMSLDEKRFRAVAQTNKIISDHNEKYNLNLKVEFIHSLAMIVVDAASKYPDFDHMTLCALISVESKFNPRAISPVKAMGLGQIMSGTAEDICYRFAWGYNDSIAFNPEKNIWMTAYYLNTLINRNRGNLELALAEYNGGQVRRVQYSFLKDKENGKLLDSLQEIEISKIPEETKKYSYLVMNREKELRDKYSLILK